MTLHVNANHLILRYRFGQTAAGDMAGRARVYGGFPTRRSKAPTARFRARGRSRAKRLDLKRSLSACRGVRVPLPTSLDPHGADHGGVEGALVLKASDLPEPTRAVAVSPAPAIARSSRPLARGEADAVAADASPGPSHGVAGEDRHGRRLEEVVAHDHPPVVCAARGSDRRESADEEDETRCEAKPARADPGRVSHKVHPTPRLSEQSTSAGGRRGARRTVRLAGEQVGPR
jgi:hypothetical protein